VTVARFQTALGEWEPWLGAVVHVVDDPPPCPALGVKELIAVAGLPRQSGAPGLLPADPQPESAPAVTRMVAAGWSVVATTASHPLAYGVVTPQTRNPRAHDRIAGGSSGGSAAAVAAGLVDVALGTDTGGSVRIPAACCGVVGLKTTHGLVPLDGVQPLAPSLDTVGPLAADVATCAAALEALTPGLPPWDPERPLRVGVLGEVDLPDLEVERVALPLFAEAAVACGVLLDVEALAVHAGLLAARPGEEGWDPGVRRRLELCREHDAAAVEAAGRFRRRWSDQVRELFARVDVLVLPVLPGPVPMRGGSVRGLTRLTAPWNLAGVPAGAVGGLQVVGPWHAEHRVLAAMTKIERLRPAAAPPRSPPAR
jgi:Asp-tRNA(Asn)/Glu-tRNA(Gln) amidotransferase A subunit family amidase